MKIWKSELDMVDRQTLNVPSGARFLAAQMQHGLPYVWFLCEETAEPEERTIAVFGTGNPMPDEPGKYIATFQTNGGDLVWHLFDMTTN